MAKQRRTGLSVARHGVGALLDRYLNDPTRCILMTVVIGLSVSSPALAQGDGCPDSGDQGDANPVMAIHKAASPTCSVPDGSYAKAYTSYDIDLPPASG